MPWKLPTRASWLELVRPATMRGMASRRKLCLGPICLTVVDVREAPDCDPDALLEYVEAAVKRLLETGTSEEIKSVAVGLDVVLADQRKRPIEGVLGGICRAYGGSFEPNYRNAHYLATELIGAAAVSNSDGAKEIQTPKDVLAISAVAWAAQEPYLRSFENPNQWLEYFHALRHPTINTGDSS